MHEILNRLPCKLKAIAVKWFLRRKSITFVGISSFSGSWPDITNGGKFLLGAGCTFSSFRLRQRIRVCENAVLEIGDNSFLNDGVAICATQAIRIGRDTKIGDMTYIYDTDFHQVSPDTPTARAPVSIGNNVWIGANSMVLRGAVIGDHSVIAAGSIVTGEIPPKSLAAGSPARVIKTLDVPDEWLRQ